MANILENNYIFNDIPFFSGNKGFSVIYLDGEFHLFFAFTKGIKSTIMHFSTSDCFTWERKEEVLVCRGIVDSVTAFSQNGKVYLYYAVNNIFNLTNVHIAVSKDCRTFEPFPSAVIKNSKLKEIKVIYSDGYRWLIGAENSGDIPAYFSSDNLSWQKSVLKNLCNDAEIIDYLGAPSPFVANNKSYVAYSSCGACVSEVEINLSGGEINLGKNVLETYGEIMRSVMIREATPIIFIGCGRSLIAVEVYDASGNIGFRFYRDALKRARLRTDNGVEENAKMPLTLVREQGILHLFELPIESGIALTFGQTTIEIDEYKSVIIDGVIENYGIVDYNLQESDVLEVAVFDMGNLLVVEVLDKIYPIPSAMSDYINVSVGEKDYGYLSYKL